MAVIAYTRVSTKGQTPESQMQALREAGAKFWYTDSITGVSTAAERPGLSELIRSVRPGDQVVVWSWSRIGRNARELLTIVETLDGLGVSLRSLTEGIETGGSNPVAKLVMTILAAVSELDRHSIAERTEAGRTAAMERGVRFGRPEKLDGKTKRNIVRAYRAGVLEQSASSLARELGAIHGVSQRTIFRAIAAAEAAEAAEKESA